MVKPPFSTLSARGIAIAMGTATAIAASLQLALGASLITLTFALAAAVVGLLAFLLEGLFTVGAWLAFFYTLGNVLIALFAKTLLGQPINSHLYAPNYSFFSILVSIVGLLASLAILRKIKIGRPLLKRNSDPHFLSFLSWACFGLGIMFWTLNQLLEKPHGLGFGGFAAFRMLILMSVIGRTAMLLDRSNDRKTFDLPLGLILAVSIAMGILDDTKTATALPVVSYYATLVFYRKGIPSKQLLALPFCAFFFVVFVTPTIQALRALGMERMDLVQRVVLLGGNVNGIYRHPGNFQRLESIAISRFKGDYYNYFGGNGAKQMLLGRFCSVQQIDPVIYQVNRQGTRGDAEIWPAIARLAPSFLYPNKPKHIESYDTLVHYRLINPAGGKFPTLPLAGQAYAAYAMIGVFVVPFLTFLTFLTVVKKIGADLHRNVYAIFLFCDFIIVYSSQGSLGQFIGAAFRYFPLFAIIFLTLEKCYRWRARGLRPTAAWGLLSRVSPFAPFKNNQGQ